MTGFTHGAVGAFIGMALPLPVALPVALASHFVLDMLPHYGIPHTRRNERFWRVFTTLDFILAWGFLGSILVIRHDYAMLLCGIVGACPDFIWVARIVRTRSFDLSKNKRWFTKWHAGIQRLERPWGILIELPIIVALGCLAFTAW